MVKKQITLFAVIIAIMSISFSSFSYDDYGVLRGSKPPSDNNETRAEAAATTFNYIWHWPAEYGSFNADEWQFAPKLQPGSDGNYTASFRDVALGAAITIQCYGLESGETWSATWIKPDGQSIGTSTLTYLNGCFYGGLWYACGCGWPPYMNWETFTFYITTQCSDTGLWRVDLDHNGVVYATKYINILPQVDVSKLPNPPFNQLNYSDKYGLICHAPEDYNKVVHCEDDDYSKYHFTIAEKGCALTSFCEIMGYHGIQVDPPTLNSWLKENDGYDGWGNVKYRKLPEFAKSKGKTFSYVACRHSCDELLGDICKYGPQSVHVKQGGSAIPNHWVTAYGKDQALTTCLIVDPYGGLFTDTN